MLEVIGGWGYSGLGAIRGLFYKIHDNNFLANDISKKVEGDERGHVLPHFNQIWGIS